MTLVALSASYGAAGSRVGPMLAERLGVPFLDRAIPLAVAERLHVPVDEAVAHDEQVGTSLLERILRGFIGGDNAAPTAVPAADVISGEDFRDATEAALREQAATGEGVILGRGSVIVLRDDPRVLRARLHGPAERRVRLAMQLGGLDEETAQRARRTSDHAHEAYARRFYGARLDDPALYHLMVDPTAIGVEATVEILLTAARSLDPAGSGRFRRG